MNERQRRFAQYFAATGNAAEAARRAGYSERTARSQGQRLLTNGDVRKEIDAFQAQLDDERIAGAREVLTTISEILRDEEQKASARLKAGTIILKTSGAFFQSSGDPPQIQQNDPETAQDDAVNIFLPWNILSPFAITGVLEADGSITRLEIPDNDTVFYIPRAELERYTESLEYEGTENDR